MHPKGERQGREQIANQQHMHEFAQTSLVQQQGFDERKVGILD